MSKCGYTLTSGADNALAAATARTILGVRGNAAFGVDIRKVTVGFNGVTASAVPVLVELCYCTFATNPPATNSTGRTIQQSYGRVVANGVTGATLWTVEPTALTVIKDWLLTPNGGLIIEEFSYGAGMDSAPSEGYVIRCTAPAIVSVRGAFEFERS